MVPFSLVEVYWCFEGTCCLQHHWRGCRKQVPLQHRHRSTRLEHIIFPYTFIFMLSPFSRLNL